MSFIISVLLGFIFLIIVMKLDNIYQNFLGRHFSIMSKRYVILSFLPLTLMLIITLLLIFILLEV